MEEEQHLLKSDPTDSNVVHDLNPLHKSTVKPNTMSAPFQAPERLPPPPVDPSAGTAHPTSAPPPSTGAGAGTGASPIPSGAAAREITEPTDQNGIAQKPVPERADPQQGKSPSASIKYLVSDGGLILGSGYWSRTGKRRW